MKRCVIVGAARIGRIDMVRQEIRPDDFMVYCDGGLYNREALGRVPDLIVGDFDSHPRPQEKAETIVLPREKDDTDSSYAVKEALRRGYEEFILLGAAGERMDHTLVNLSLLLYLDGQGKRAKLLDDYSEMEIVSAEPAYIEDSFAYFSLLNISGTARGVCIENARYPLRDAEIPCERQYATSNEVLPGQRAKVTVAEGRLLLIKIW